MKKLFLLCSLALIICARADENKEIASEETKLTTKNILEHGEFWVKQLPELSSEETALLANFLYFSFLNSHYESVTRMMLINVHTHWIVMNKQLAANEMEARKIASTMAGQLKSIQEELLPLHLYSIKSWKECLSAIEKSEYMTLKKVIVSLQNYGEMVLTQFMKQDRPFIEKLIQNGHNSLDAHLKTLDTCNGLLQSLLDHKNPHVKEGDNVDAVDMHVTLTTADAILSCTNEISLSASNMKQMSVDMLNISAFIFKNFYSTYYNWLESEHMLPLHVMFNQNGLIAAEDRDEYVPGFAQGSLVINKKHYA